MACLLSRRLFASLFRSEMRKQAGFKAERAAHIGQRLFSIGNETRQGIELVYHAVVAAEMDRYAVFG